MGVAEGSRPGHQLEVGRWVPSRGMADEASSCPRRSPSSVSVSAEPRSARAATVESARRVKQSTLIGLALTCKVLSNHAGLLAVRTTWNPLSIGGSYDEQGSPDRPGVRPRDGGRVPIWNRSPRGTAGARGLVRGCSKRFGPIRAGIGPTFPRLDLTPTIRLRARLADGNAERGDVAAAVQTWRTHQSGGPQASSPEPWPDARSGCAKHRQPSGAPAVRGG